MSDDPRANGWRVITRESFMMDADHVLIGRVAGDRVETVTGLSSSPAEITGRPRYVADDFTGLLVPSGVLYAIADHVRPGPSRAELARLEDALQVERARVDQLLDRATIPNGPR